MNKLFLFSLIAPAANAFSGAGDHAQHPSALRAIAKPSQCPNDMTCLQAGALRLTEDKAMTARLNNLLRAKALKQRMALPASSAGRSLLQSCITAKDCNGALMWCPANTCQTKSSDFCNDDYDCQGTKYCKSGWCEESAQVGNGLPDVGISCSTAKDCNTAEFMTCGSDSVCYSKHNDWCNDNNDCQTSKTCNNGWCELTNGAQTGNALPSTGTSCRTAKDCPEAEGLYWCGGSNTCEPKSSDFCNDNEDCQGSKNCDGGWCNQGSSASKPNYRAYHNYVMMGTFEEGVDMVYSAEDCAAECNSRGWCVAFEYAYFGARCQLIRYMSPAMYAQGWDLYVLN